MCKILDTQNLTPFFLENAELCIYSNKEDRPLFVVKPTQKHTNHVVEIITGSEDLDAYDGLYTKQKDITLAIGTSDCAPICFISKNQIGILHAGWRGALSGIIEKMLEFFSEKPIVYVGPFLHEFEIRKDFCYDAIFEKHGAVFFEEREGSIIFLFKKFIESKLGGHEVYFDSRNTHDDLTLPSHRRGTDYNFLTTIKRPNSE